jgi:hypothetical protein
MNTEYAGMAPFTREPKDESSSTTIYDVELYKGNVEEFCPYIVSRAHILVCELSGGIAPTCCLSCSMLEDG